VEVRYNWVTYNHRYQHTDAWFGSTCVTLTTCDGKPQILRKTVRLNNDYIRQVIDVYHI
jgi:benzoate/toluate 1,2-dioxygenase beta subunit